MGFDNEKKLVILEKAKDMIITEGYSNLSISKLTSELNISKGSFYTYFPSKDNMLAEILDEYSESTKIFSRNLISHSNNLDECLNYYVNSMINFIKEALNKYKNSIKIKEKDFEKCSKMIFSIAQVFLMMENVNFETNKFSSKTLNQVKELYRSKEMKENLEFIKESIKKILYK